MALAAEKGLTLSVYQNRRWDCDFLTVKEILDKGLLGRLVEFESTFPVTGISSNPIPGKKPGRVAEA